jgi:transcriptional regulator with PAS, ATPase and Fis domain
MTSGTPTMCATWLLLGRGLYDAVLLQSSRERGVEYIQLPYDVSLQAKQDQKIIQLSEHLGKQGIYFKGIPAQSPKMREAIHLAQLIAPRNIPVIIQGATGTGKEVLAQAIHEASPRAEMPFIPVNCGAIPDSLIDAELFGHKRGAFTGADFERKGHFEAAEGGTLFLDELGELPLSAQVKLLRVLQQSEVVRLGESKPRKINVRIIAATHRDLLQMISDGTFREDLFYRLAVGLIHLPSLNERQEDMVALTKILLESINQELTKDGALFVAKELHPQALRYIQHQIWSGNIRELSNTLLRAAVWNPEVPVLTEENLKAAMIERRSNEPLFRVDIGRGLDLPEFIKKVKHAYIKAALEHTNTNKAAAARLLNLSSSQNLDNWLKT